MSKINNCLKCFAILTLLTVGYVNADLTSLTQTKWSSEIKTDMNYHYTAQKSDLRDLRTDEKYHNDLLGGHNLPGGDTNIKITNNLSSNFNFLEGDRLALSVIIEGDIVFTSKNDDDYNLVFLPILTKNESFFQYLFQNKTVLEELTNASFMSGNITGDNAIAELKISDYLNATYTWNINTGILLEKKVQSLSGKMLLIVVKGGEIPGYEIPEVLGGCFLLCLIILVRKKNNKYF